MRTEQEVFWQGEFGNDYTIRNRGSQSVAANTVLFGDVLAHTRDVRTVLELGSNIGLNLSALRRLLPEAHLSAVEINEQAAAELTTGNPDVEVHLASILDFSPSQTWDFVFTKGVLIHISPDKLPQVYDLMYRCSSRYVLVAEYYSRQPAEVTYRGHSGKLFKRDFAGELLDRFSDLALVDYGFTWHRDPNFPQDDISWFLMDKD
jgi:spore coat polysaccharide biosynthesis protein SpsF